MTSISLLIASHSAIIATWALVALMLTGIGLLYRRFFTPRELDAQEMLLAFWTGFAGLLLVLQVWHLLFAVNAAAVAVVAALGFLGIALERASLLAWIRARPWHGWRLGVLLTLALLAWAANRSTGPIAHYDSGMYHIPVLEWSKEYAIVPGLANLHGRLAFNSASLLYAALIDHGPWSGRSFHVANSLLLVMFGLQAVLAWTRLVSARSRPQAADAFDAVLFLPVLAVLVGGEISSLETDVPVALILLLAASRIHRSMTSAGSTSDLNRWHFAAVALLLGAAVCVKLSAVVLGGVLFLVSLAVFRHAIATHARATAGAIIVPVAMGIVWMARGVILSGYPVYPATVLGQSVPWRVSVVQANAEAEWIRMSGHELNHNRIVAGYDWLVPWAKEIVTDIRFAFLVPVPFLIALAFGLAAFVRGRRRPPSDEIAESPWLLMIPVGIGVAFWFFASPHPRFGMGPMWLGAALTMALWFRTIQGDDAIRRRQMRRVGATTAAFSLVAIVALAVFSKGGTTGRRAGGVKAIGGLVFLPGPDHGLHPMPKPVLVSYTTSSGLKLAVPKDNNLCWRGPLLCTPHPAPNLRLRNPSRVGDGFILDDGVWEPIRWPNPWTPFLPWLACRRTDNAIPPGVARDRACIALTANLPTDTLDRVTVPLTLGDPAGPRRMTRPKPDPVSR
ncbi:MAG: hypothetical protein MNPFHGCM_02075 [Gemmatimonadaceae bacterium]|nr:hypothetical protein [Gemmatimonadaceae bacterium]